jgi:hypothetical protein
MSEPAEDRHALAERVREACIEAALAGYENAAIAGLCGEGALEVAISAMRQVDLDEIATDDRSRHD